MADKCIDKLVFEEDIEDCTYTFELEVFDYHMDFNVSTGAALTEKRLPPTFVGGYLKWDHCINFAGSSKSFSYGSQMIHLCGLDGMLRLLAVIYRLYELGSEHIPEWDDSVPLEEISAGIIPQHEP